MIYRAKLGLQNTKQIVGYSPLYSPSHHKKGSVIKLNKFSPKPSNRENKENIEQKQPKTQRVKQEKYFKITKEEALSSAKKPQKNTKISISISLNQRKKSIAQFDDLGLLNIETPKFKCSSNKVDDRCKTEYLNMNEKYFSFGDQFRENLKISLKPNDSNIIHRQKKPTTTLKERIKNAEQDMNMNQKISIDAIKKKQKLQKIKQTEQKLELRFMQHERQMKDSKFKKDRDVFCFKK